MENVEAAVVIIRRNGQCLLRWNSRWNAWNLPSTKRHGAESFPDSARRVLHDDLGLNLDNCDIALVKSVELDQVSPTRGSSTHYDFRVFAGLFGNDSPLVFSKLDQDSNNRWLAPSQIKEQPSSSPVSDTTERLLLNLIGDQLEIVLPARATLSQESVARLLDPLRRSMTTVCRSGLAVLAEQRDPGAMVHASKSDTLAFDYRVQNDLMFALMSELHRMAAQHQTSFAAEILGEEDAIKMTIGSDATFCIRTTLDPVDGSSNVAAHISSSPRYRALLPRPDAGISLALQIPEVYGDEFVVGVAADSAANTIYSANLAADSFLTYINDFSVDPSEFKFEPAAAPKINLPFYAHHNVALMGEVMDALYKRTKAKLYPGRTRSSIMDLIRMLAKDCDAYVDIRALDPQGGAALYPWDVCGMVPFFKGLGWVVCNERGKEVNFEQYDRRICFIVANTPLLGESIIQALKPVVDKYQRPA